ncbi:MAG: TonB-dependent receptor plug domain-containing protein [Flavobacteriaceae bacterium]
MRYLKFISCLIVGMSCLVQATAQELYIQDGESFAPIENVVVYSTDKERSTMTNAQGMASLKEFLPQETLAIQYYGYQPQQFVYDPSQSSRTILIFPETQNLEGVILSVARSQSNRNEIAEKVAVISADAIQRNPMGTGADLLALTPGVRVQKSQGGGGSPVLRGFEANRVLLVVDGVRMNNAIYRSGHLQNAITLDPNTIERVEVMFGSSSVGYGSDALGGVIHYYTKTPLLNAEKTIRGRISSEFNSATQAGLYHAATEISREKWASYTSLSFSQYGDIRMGESRTHGFTNWGLNPLYSENTRTLYKADATVNPDPNVQKNTGYSQYDLLQKFVFQLPKSKQIHVNFQLSTSSDINRFDKLNEVREGRLRFSEWYYGPQQRLFIATQYKLFPNTLWMEKGTLTAAYQNIFESRNKRPFDSFTRSSQEETVNVFSLNGDFSTKISQNHHVNYGFEGVYNHVYSRGYSQLLAVNGETISGLGLPLTIPSRYPSDESYTQTYALYANWIWKYSPQWTYNLGYRLTHYELFAQWKDRALIDPLLNEVSLSPQALTWTLAAVYRPSENWQWNVLLSNGFKAPNIDDIGKIRENSGFLIVPNSFLKPEYAYNFDIGFRFVSDNKKANIALRNYLTLVSRHIVRSNYSVFSDTSTADENTILYDGEEFPTVANKNLGNRWVYGSALDATWRPTPSWSVAGNLTFTGADNHERYGPMPSISPLFGSLQTHFEKNRFLFRARLQFSHSKHPDTYSFGGEDGLEETPLIHPNSEDRTDQYAGTPAWNEVSLLANYNWTEQVRVKAGLENIFDTHYRTFASGISAPGRSFRLGIQVDL